MKPRPAPPKSLYLHDAYKLVMLDVLAARVQRSNPVYDKTTCRYGIELSSSLTVWLTDQQMFDLDRLIVGRNLYLFNPVHITLQPETDEVTDEEAEAGLGALFG